MNEFINIRINNPHGLILLQELDAVGVITIEKKSANKTKAFNGKQYRGIVPLEESQKLTQHLENIRNEWERDI